MVLKYIEEEKNTEILIEIFNLGNAILLGENYDT